jgi:hypothetical protein
MVVEVRKRLSVRELAVQNFDKEGFNVENLNDM